jgi:hypothetical protein
VKIAKKWGKMAKKWENWGKRGQKGKENGDFVSFFVSRCFFFVKKWECAKKQKKTKKNKKKGSFRKKNTNTSPKHHFLSHSDLKKHDFPPKNTSKMTENAPELP